MKEFVLLLLTCIVARVSAPAALWLLSSLLNVGFPTPPPPFTGGVKKIFGSHETEAYKHTQNAAVEERGFSVRG